MNFITNNADIPIALAVWLVSDEYDYINAPNYMSATSLMKPLRPTLLAKRVPPELQQDDVENYISRALGTAIHDSMEKAWKVHYRTNLKKLGYSESMINRVLINPTDYMLDRVQDPIPVYLEKRMFRSHRGYTIGGKYDAITEGIVNDTKSTSAFAWLYGGKDEDYQLQGSIYRWLDAKGLEMPNEDDSFELAGAVPFRPRITQDFMRINFVFTDWKKVDAISNPAYPQRRVEQRELQLLPLSETENWINNKIRQLETFKDAPEGDLPECTPEELWMSEPSYKYYKDPAKANQPGARSTKNFDDMGEAVRFMNEKGGVGVIKTVPGAPKRCGYCPAYEVCGQRQRLGV